MTLVYLSQREANALQALIFRCGVVFLKECVPAELESSLLKKFGLAVKGSEIVLPGKAEADTLVKTVTLEEGFTLSILRHSQDGETMFWYRIKARSGEEVDWGLYVITEAIAEEQGLHSWDRMRAGWM